MSAVDSFATSPTETLSHVTSHSSTCTWNTRATTPEPGLAFAYRTILVSADDQLSIKLIEAAFASYEPFENWKCAFCSQEEKNCACQAWQVESATIPSTKKDFLEYLDSQTMTASTVQQSIASYLLALHQHVPLGMAFNDDQKVKCNTMNQQLELIKDRIKDLTTASSLLILDEDVIPDGLKIACDCFTGLLANCLGNARENHVCFKLNYMLTLGK